MSISNLPVVRVSDFVKSSGLFDGFTDVYGNEQPAAEHQVNTYDETVMSQNQNTRYVAVIRPSGNQSPTRSLYQAYQFKVVCFGLSSPESELRERFIVEGWAAQIEQWLNDNFRSSEFCINNIKINGGLMMPMKTEDNRSVYEITITADFNANLTQQQS